MPKSEARSPIDKTPRSRNATRTWGLSGVLRRPRNVRNNRAAAFANSDFGLLIGFRQLGLWIFVRISETRALDFPQGQLPRQGDGSSHAGRIGLALPRDVVGGPVIRRGPNEGQP